MGSLWAVGSAFFIFRLGLADLGVKRLKKDSALASGPLQEATAEWARHFRLSPPAVWLNPRIGSPALVGLFQPMIVLPQDESSITFEVLLHELCHLRRGDGWWLLIGQVTLSLLFFNPLVWWIVRKQEQSAEEVCDDWVVLQTANPAGYAEQLVDLAERQTKSLPIGLASVLMASYRSNLRLRVERVLDSTRVVTLKLSHLATGLIALITLSCIIFLGLVRPIQAKEALKSPAATTGPAPQAPHLPTKLDSPDPNSNVIVKDIELNYDGPKSVDPTVIYNALEFQKGKEYPEGVLQSLGSRSVKRLYATNLFTNLRVSVEQESPSNEVKIVVIVLPRPKISGIHIIQQDGNPCPQEGLILSGLQSRLNHVMSEVDVFSDSCQIENKLAEFTGFRRTVTYKIDFDEEHGQASVIFNVSR